MPSLTQIAVLATVVLIACSTATPVAVPRHTVASLPAILTAALKPVCPSLDIVTPLTNEVKSILSAAVSEASALAASPPSTILSTEGCEYGRTSSSSSDDNSLSAPDGVLSVPEDNPEILSVNDVAQRIASILSVVTSALGAVHSVVQSTSVPSQADVDVIESLLHNATISIATHLEAISLLVSGLSIAFALLVAGLTRTLENLGSVFNA
ncbi:hypothetical protein C8R44DRAFT_880842 [Mycena epipterygia]|nr:hypothetical protein C8R44DRAFT_880842 [Mycena epipterygia]